MILADKQDLQRQLTLSLLRIDEKELEYFTQNCFAMGTQAALFALFGFDKMVEARSDVTGGSMGGETAFQIKMAWITFNALNMVAGLAAVVKATQMSIRIPGLALRGPEGSMARAVQVMRTEYWRLHAYFMLSLVALHISTAIYSHILFEGDAHLTIPTALIVTATLVYLLYDYLKLKEKVRAPCREGRALWRRNRGGGEGGPERSRAASASARAAPSGPPSVAALRLRALRAQGAARGERGAASPSGR